MTVLKAESCGRNLEMGPTVRWPAEELAVFKEWFGNTELVINFITDSQIHLGMAENQFIKYAKTYTVFPDL